MKTLATGEKNLIGNDAFVWICSLKKEPEIRESLTDSYSLQTPETIEHLPFESNLSYGIVVLNNPVNNIDPTGHVTSRGVYSSYTSGNGQTLFGPGNCPMGVSCGPNSVQSGNCPPGVPTCIGGGMQQFATYTGTNGGNGLPGDPTPFACGVTAYCATLTMFLPPPVANPVASGPSYQGAVGNSAAIGNASSGGSQQSGMLVGIDLCPGCPHPVSPQLASGTGLNPWLTNTVNIINLYSHSPAFWNQMSEQAGQIARDYTPLVYKSPPPYDLFFGTVAVSESALSASAAIMAQCLSGNCINAIPIVVNTVAQSQIEEIVGPWATAASPFLDYYTSQIISGNNPTGTGLGSGNIPLYQDSGSCMLTNSC